MTSYSDFTGLTCHRLHILYTSFCLKLGMSLPWSACIQTFSDSFYSHSNDSTPLTGRSERFRVSDGAKTRSSMIGRAWQMFCGGQVKCHIIHWLWTGENMAGTADMWRFSGDIMVRILCLDPQMACFLPISVGVEANLVGYTSQPR